MSAYVVKDAELEIELNLSSLKEVEIPVNVDLGLLEQKLQQQVEMDKPKSKRRKRKISFLSSTMETIKLRFDPRPAKIFLNAYGPALHKFIHVHKSKELGMNFIATFENGVEISCEMKSDFARKNYMFGTNQRMRFFKGDVSVNSKLAKMFKKDQMLVGKYSLEIISHKACSFEDISVLQVTPMLKGFLEKGKYSDFAIIAENGSRIPCHKVFLGERSPVLNRMLQMDCKETQENCVKFEASEEGVRVFLKYVYYGDLEDAFGSPIIALELLELAHLYDIKPLETTLVNLFLKRSDAWLDMDAALNLYLTTVGKAGLENLKWKALQLIKARKDELNGSSFFREFLKRDPNEVTELFKSFL